MSNERTENFSMGSIVRMLRIAMGLELKDFCRLLGISYNFLSLVENDRRTFSRTTMREMEGKLGVPPGFMEFMIFNPADLGDGELAAKIGKCQEEALGLVLLRCAQRKEDFAG